MPATAILHLSDLHFGPHSRFATLKPEALAERLAHALRDPEELSSEVRAAPLGVVITTGDLVETATPREYALAQRFFSRLAEVLPLARERFVFAPGNHDVYWTRCQLEEEARESSPDALRASLDRVKFESFHQFLCDFYGTPLDQIGAPLGGIARYPVLHDYPALHLSIAALNSSERESHRRSDHIGFIGEAQATALLQAWQKPGYDAMLKIIAVHHNPLAIAPSPADLNQAIKKIQERASDDVYLLRFVTDLVGFEGKEYLERIARNACPQLLLHGHQHHLQERAWNWRERGQMHILSAGSFGSNELPSDQDNMARLIILDSGSTDAQAYSLVYRPRALRDTAVTGGAFCRERKDDWLQDISLPRGLRPLPKLSFPYQDLTADERERALRGPGDDVVWLADRDQPGAASRAIAALANRDPGATPGLLLIGMESSGPRNLFATQPPERERDLGTFLDRVFETLLPRPPLSACVLEHLGAHLAAVRVPPSAATVQSDGKVYELRGGVPREASTALRPRPERTAAVPFDEQLAPGAQLSDLNEQKLRELHEIAQSEHRGTAPFPALEPWLVREGLGALVDARYVPNLAAILAFGKAPSEFIRNAEVIFVRYQGVDVEVVQSRREIRGSLSEQAEDIEALLRNNLQETPAEAESASQTPYRPEYPLKALIELARNLLQHRDYERRGSVARIEWFADRVVFTNPGGPIEQAKEAEFGQYTAYRNLALTRAMYLLRYTERHGRGVRLAKDLLKRNGNPPLQVETDGYTTLTVRRGL